MPQQVSVLSLSRSLSDVRVCARGHPHIRRSAAARAARALAAARKRALRAARVLQHCSSVTGNVKYSPCERVLDLDPTLPAPLPDPEEDDAAICERCVGGSLSGLDEAEG